MGSLRKAIAVIGGGGYVGLITAVEFALRGYTVWCVDVDARKMAELAEGKPQFEERGLRDALRKILDGRAPGTIHWTTSHAKALAESDFVFIAVPTPPPPTRRPRSSANGDRASDAEREGSSNGHARRFPERPSAVEAYDMSKVDTCIEQLARAGLTGDHVLVMKSTVPCGTRGRVASILDRYGLEVPYLSCPEFLKEGSALEDSEKPDRIVIGDSGDPAGARLAELYEGVRYGALERVLVESAELVKLASNSWLATQVAFVNELANLCDALDPRADVMDVIRAIVRPEIPDDFLKPGVGFGGSCFPKDVRGLWGVAVAEGRSFDLLEAVLLSNERQPMRAVEKVRAALGGLEGRAVALLGLAFKPGTDDTREASSVALIAALVREGARVLIYDPVAKELGDHAMRQVPKRGWHVVAGQRDCLSRADAAVLVTDWDEFKGIDWKPYSSRLRVVVDGRNALDERKVLDAGIAYEGIGRHVAGMGADAERTPPKELGQEAALALLAVKRAFMAEIAAVASQVGADWTEVSKGVALDRRIGDECVGMESLNQTELDLALAKLRKRALDSGFHFSLIEAQREAPTPS